MKMTGSILSCLLMLANSMVLISNQAYAAEALNVRLVGHSDLHGREALQVVLKESYAYVGHHRGEKYNPLTGKIEPNGTTILDVSDPNQPKIIKHIPGYRLTPEHT